MIPASWASIQDWMRMVALQVNPVLQGYPYMQLEADPASPTEGFTYYNRTSHKVRTFDGTIWRDHW